MRTITASALQRVMTCAAAASLPAVTEEAGDAAAMGSDLHLYLQRVEENGRKAALSATPDALRGICESIAVDWIERLRGESASEQAYAYNALEGTAVKLGRLDRGYPAPERGEVFCTIDLIVTASDEPALVSDYKTGRHRVTPCRDNWQLRLAALAVARETGADSARMRVAYLLDSGGWDFDGHTADALDLDCWAAELKMAYLRTEAADEVVQRGGTPDVHPTDDGCKWCPAKRACPAYTSAALAIRNNEAIAQKARRVSELEPAEVGDVYAWLQRAKEFVKQVEGDLTAYLERQPVPIAPGRVLKLVEQQREYLDGDITYKTISGLLGADRADKVCGRSASKTDLKALGKDRARVLDAVRAAGGIDVKTYRNVKEVKED